MAWTTRRPTRIVATCRICATPLCSGRVTCSVCCAPAHWECWEYNGGCATYACAHRPERLSTIRRWAMRRVGFVPRAGWPFTCDDWWVLAFLVGPGVAAVATMFILWAEVFSPAAITWGVALAVLGIGLFAKGLREI